MVRHLKYGVRKFWATVTLLSLELIVVLIAFFGSMAGFVFVARMIFLKDKKGLDARAYSFMRGLVNDVNTDIMQVFSFFGAHDFLIPANILLVAYFLFIKKHRWYSIRIPAIAISSVAMMSLLKLIFQRPRPEVPLIEAARGLSFPSGHATMSCTFYGLIIYMIFRSVENRVARWLLISAFLMLIIMIGASRVYLNVHYATDVIAGFCLGTMWLVLSIWILKKMELYSKRKVNPVVQAAPETATQQLVQ